ncbi:MAG: hypothetical protein OEX02_14625 [Cyclobacteriaceae bacterium]|nr:hypothetical protein [Cyclobacteriaceae bacterium]
MNKTSTVLFLILFSGLNSLTKPGKLACQVSICTAYAIPHILANNLRAFTLGLTGKASTSVIPHSFGRYTTATTVRPTQQLWTSLISFEKISQLENPKRWYLQNATAPFYANNLHGNIFKAGLPGKFPPLRLRLRSPHSLSLRYNNDNFTLEDFTERKHILRLLATYRLKNDLTKLLKERLSDEEIYEQWDKA